MRQLVRSARSASAVLAILALSAQASCGDPSSAPSSDREPRVDDGAGAPGAPLALTLRDTVLTVGQSSKVEVTDAAFAAASRLRFFSASTQWTSSDTTVAVVEPDGTVRARAAGVATLRGVWRERVGTVTIRVEAVATPAPEDPPAPPAPPAPPQTPPPPQFGIPELPTGSPAELPRAYVEYPTQDGAGRTINVRRGGRVQDAINAAVPGDVILLEAGVTFSEAIVLRRKTGSGWITIRSEGTPTPVGVRVSLDDTLRFARLQSPSGSPTVSTEAGANGYRLVNLHLTISPTRSSHNTLVEFGDGGSEQNTVDKIPRRLVVDRSIVRGRPDLTLRRCISMHSAETAVANSLVLECHEKGADSQGIGSWNGPGPFLIENNWIEGAGQNILFGGAHPAIHLQHPSDIVIRFNVFRKPGEWQASKRWTIKNHLQFKHAQRVLIYHNLLEGNWGDAQTGSSIAISSSNQGGGRTTWAESRDFSIFENVIRNTGRGMVITALGSNAAADAVSASRVLLAGNLLYKLGDNSLYGGRGDPLTMMRGVAHVMIVQNTFDGLYNAFSLPSDADPPRVPNMTYERNVTAFNTYGVFGGGLGVLTIQARYSPSSFRSNCFYGVRNWNYAPASSYPAPNVTTGDVPAATMPRINDGDPTLSAGSPCRSIPLAAGQRLGARPDLVSMLEAWVVPGRRP